MKLTTTLKNDIDGRSRNRRGGRTAFTLIEMLVVVGIIGIIVSVGIPSIQKLSKPNTIAVAQRQLLDACTYARYLALSTRSTVHLAFITEELSGLNTNRWDGADANQVSELLGVQNRGYAIYATRSVGDQPGRSNPRYLADWSSLPDHVFISTNEFFFNTNLFTYSSIRFPHVDSTNKVTLAGLNSISAPTISFNSKGQLASGRDAYIPISQGSVIYPMNAAGTQFMVRPPSTIDTTQSETTIIPGVRYYVRAGTGSINYNGSVFADGESFVGSTAAGSFTAASGTPKVILFQGIHINWLTGRARIVKPGVNS